MLERGFDRHDPTPIPRGLDEGLLSGAKFEGVADSSGSRAGLCELNLVAADLSVELACHTANERARHVIQGWAQRQTATLHSKQVGAVAVDRSSRGLQLSRVEQKIAGRAPGIPVPVVADDDNSLHAADDGRAHPFGLLKAS